MVVETDNNADVPSAYPSCCVFYGDVRLKPERECPSCGITALACENLSKPCCDQCLHMGVRCTNVAHRQPTRADYEAPKPGDSRVVDRPQAVTDRKDQCSGVSDARKRIEAYLGRRQTHPLYADVIHWTTGPDAEDLTVSDLRTVLADADRDRQFAEAVRTEVAHRRERRAPHDGVVWFSEIDAISEYAYGTPCTAKENA